MKVLLLTSSLPWPLEMHGGAQRTALLLEAFRAFADVEIVFISWSKSLVEHARVARLDESRLVRAFEIPELRTATHQLWGRLPLVGKPLRTVQKELAWYQINEPLHRWLQGEIQRANYDAVVSRYLWPGAVAGLSRISDVPRLLDWDDLDHLKLRSRLDANPWSGVRGAITKSLVLSRIEKFCLSEARSYDHVWVAKPSDASGFRLKGISVLPNIPIIDTDATTPAQSPKSKNVLFVGNQTYLPNSDALTKFLMTVWPRIFAIHSDARLLAIGPHPHPEIEALWRKTPGVEIVGTVPSLAPYYCNAALSICPVEWGGGSNIKAVESLAYGVPCVASPYTYAAFNEDFSAQTGMICAHSDDEYVTACIEILENPSRSAALGRAGQEIVRMRYSKSRFQKIVHTGLSQAGVPNTARPAHS